MSTARTCRDVRARLFAAIEGSLPIEETLAIEDHARSCAGCAVDVHRARQLHEAFAQLPQAPVERLDIERQVAAIREAIERDVESGVRPWPWRWIAAAAFLVAIGCAGWRLLASGPARTTPDTSHRVVEVPHEAHVGVEPPNVVTPEREPIDVRRLEAARERVRAALIACAPALASHSVDAGLERFNADTLELARENWPIVRLVERVAAEDHASAREAALRWLGKRGDALSARRIAAALDDPLLKHTAASALLELGPKGVDLLAPTLLDEELRDTVMDQLAARDPAAAAALLEKATRLGPRPLDARTALALVARGRLTSAIPWLEEVVRERSMRGDREVADLAVSTLGRLGGAEALRSLLQLKEAGRHEDAQLESVIQEMLAGPGDAASALAHALAAAKRTQELRTLHEALLSAPCRSIVPALIIVASSHELAPAERRFAILLAGEQGDREHVAALTDLFRRLERRERSLKAAALVAIHGTGGREAAAAALADATPRTRERALAVFDRADWATRPETTLLQIAKELEPLLAPLQL